MALSDSKLLPADDAGIAQAAQLLRAAELVAVPTETVYGLAARADSAAAVAQIYRAKGRPDFNPLIVHVAALEQARELAHCDTRCVMLAERYWPGPLSMVLPLRKDAQITPAVTAGLDTIALRSPAHPVIRRLLEVLDLPLAAPSANRSAGISPTCPEHVRASLGEKCPPILDGGICEQGVESTIIALRADGSWQLLRPGPIAREELIELLGQPTSSAGGSIEAPGQLVLHYSPGKPLRLNAPDALIDEFHIGFGDIAGDVCLSRTGDLAEAAANLYASLHTAAGADHPRIAVAPVPTDSMGEAINDRLQRAAAT